VPVLAIGFVSFELQQKSKGREWIQYHLESVMKENERSVPVMLSAAISMKSNGKFDSNCVCQDSNCEDLKSWRDVEELVVGADNVDAGSRDVSLFNEM